MRRRVRLDEVGGGGLPVLSPPSPPSARGGASTLWGRLAPFRNDLGPFCAVLQRFGFVLLRSALIWCYFAALCNDLVSFCTVLQGFGAVCNVLQRFGVHSPESGLIL